MTNIQRLKSDMSTIGRREVADKNLRDNRIRNDELTIERRSEADNLMKEKRLKNDEITANRREVKDENPLRDLAVISLVLVVLVAAILFIVI